MATTKGFLILAPAILLLLLNVLPPSCTAEEVLVAPGKLQSGEYLSVGKYKFGMRGDCRLAAYDGHDAVWSSNNTVLPDGGCTAVLRDDGYLRVFDPWFTQVWQSDNTESTVDYYALILQPNGVVAIYTKPVWSSGTIVPNPIRSSAQVMLPTTTLQAGEYLSTGSYKFMLESDCNLSLFHRGKRTWSTNTQGKASGCFLSFSYDGYLTLYDKVENKLWRSAKSALTPGHVLVMQPSRQVVIYSRTVWTASSTKLMLPEQPSEDQLL